MHVISHTGTSTKKSEAILNVISQSLNIYEAFKIFQGKFEEFGILSKSIGKIFTQFAGGPYSLELRKSMCRKVCEELKANIIIPPQLQEGMLLGFEPQTVISEILEKYSNSIIEEIMEFDKKKDKKRLGEQLSYLFSQGIGECISELVEGFGNSFPLVETLIKLNIKNLFENIDGGVVGLSLGEIAVLPLYEFLVNNFRRYQEEEEKKINTKKAPQIPEEKKNVPLADFQKEKISLPAVVKEEKKTPDTQPALTKLPQTKPPEESKTVPQLKPKVIN